MRRTDCPLHVETTLYVTNRGGIWVSIPSVTTFQADKEQLFESIGSVSPEKNLISLLDFHKHGLSVLAGVVVWMPCPRQLPVATTYLLQRRFFFQGQNLRHKHIWTLGWEEKTLLSNSTLMDTELVRSTSNDHVHLQGFFFPLRVLFEQDFQHLLPSVLVVAASSQDTQDPIWHQENVLQHTSEPRQKPEYIQ